MRDAARAAATHKWVEMRMRTDEWQGRGGRGDQRKWRDALAQEGTPFDSVKSYRECGHPPCSRPGVSGLAAFALPQHAGLQGLVARAPGLDRCLASRKPADALGWPARCHRSESGEALAAMRAGERQRPRVADFCSCRARGATKVPCGGPYGSNTPPQGTCESRPALSSLR